MSPSEAPKGACKIKSGGANASITLMYSLFKELQNKVKSKSNYL